MLLTDFMSLRAVAGLPQARSVDAFESDGRLVIVMKTDEAHVFRFYSRRVSAGQGPIPATFKQPARPPHPGARFRHAGAPAVGRRPQQRADRARAGRADLRRGG